MGRPRIPLLFLAIPMNKPLTVTIPLEEAAWLRSVAAQCNLTPQEVVRLQVLAKQHLSPAMMDDDAEAPATTVLESLRRVREQLDDLKTKSRDMPERSIRFSEEQTRMLHDPSGASRGLLQRPSGSTASPHALIEEVLTRMEEVSSQLPPEEPFRDEDARSMFEIADGEDSGAGRPGSGTTDAPH
jgi:hypothetical protein